MLMHAALPGTQHLNDSKSASAPLWGWDTAPCSTSSHHSPWTLNVPHWLSEMTLAQNRGRGPQRAAAFWVLEILGNSCCGSRQTSAGVPCSPEPSPAWSRGATTHPWGTALPRAALPRAELLLPRAQRLLWACPAGHWPSVALQGPWGAAGDAAPVPNPRPCRAHSPSCWHWGPRERSQEDFSLESPITASCLWAPSPQHTTYSMKYECTEILTGTLLCYSSSQMEFMNCEIDFHFQECLNM